MHIGSLYCIIFLFYHLQIRLVDMKCINSLLTLEHLSLMCQEKGKDNFEDCTLPSCKRSRIRHNSHSRASRFSMSENYPSNCDLKYFTPPSNRTFK